MFTKRFKCEILRNFQAENGNRPLWPFYHQIVYGSFGCFFRENNQFPITEINEQIIESYLGKIIREKNISAAYQKHLIGSVKLFYKMVFSRVLQIDHLFPQTYCTHLA